MEAGEAGGVEGDESAEAEAVAARVRRARGGQVRSGEAERDEEDREEREWRALLDHVFGCSHGSSHGACTEHGGACRSIRSELWAPYARYRAQRVSGWVPSADCDEIMARLNKQMACVLPWLEHCLCEG